MQLGVPPQCVAVQVAPIDDASPGPNRGTPPAVADLGPHQHGTAPVVQGERAAVRGTRRPRTTIGRQPDNDVVLTDLLVSRRHAELHSTADGWVLVDLDSDNGTYVNGARITTAAIGPGDTVAIGRAQLHLVDDRLITYVDTGEVEFAASDLSVVTDDGRRILDGVGFALPERSLLAVVGPSGSGKSTLLNALTGFRPATQGRVDYGGRDLYADYEELRQRIGLVPQDDILHSQLTVSRALSYSAKLRFPQDVPAADRQQRVAEVLDELSLAQHAGKRISALSGGQRKRTSVALELLTKPSLLFLDEPTSGLDPGMDKSVMQTLRGLADEGRTVVVVTHALANIDLCDRLLVLGRGGQLAFFGPPDEALSYFGQRDIAEIFLLLDEESDVDWGARFRASPHYQRYVTAPSQRGHSPGQDRVPARKPGVGPRQQSPLRQFTILCQRYLAVIAADRQFAVLLFVLPVLLSLLTLVVPGSSGLSVSAALDPAASNSDRMQPTQMMLLLIIAGLLMGAFQSVRELVKEREIYRRERAIGLSMTAYLCSKLVVLGVLVGMQAVLLGVLGVAWHNPPDDPVVLPSASAEIVLAIVFVTLASMLLGLLISVVIDNADRSMPPLVLVIMLQIILSGGLFTVDRPVLQQLSWLSPSRWSYAMGATTTDLNLIQTEGDDPLWEHAASTWTGHVLVLCALMLATAFLVWLLLGRFDPRAGQRR
ncbi:MAG: ATP-binding cassette domain-containing protein [Pseudonocardiaceae bacterium]